VVRIRAPGVQFRSITGAQLPDRIAFERRDRSRDVAGDGAVDTVPAFWRVYGGSLLVTATLGVLTVFNSLSTELAQLRRDIAHEQEARAQFVTTAELDAVMDEQNAQLRAVEDAFGSWSEAPVSPASPASPES
jgi:hypothetical protein